MFYRLSLRAEQVNKSSHAALKSELKSMRIFLVRAEHDDPKYVGFLWPLSRGHKMNLRCGGMIYRMGKQKRKHNVFNKNTKFLSFFLLREKKNTKKVNKGISEERKKTMHQSNHSITKMFVLLGCKRALIS